jgi:hypothetical protein
MEVIADLGKFLPVSVAAIWRAEPLLLPPWQSATRPLGAPQNL